MGADPKKLRDWAPFEYNPREGSVIGGPCGPCVEAHAKKRVPEDPPCHKCPKYKLRPGPTFGLHPKAVLAVELYNLAARDIRVGMDAVLIGTLTPEAAKAIIDLYSEHLPTAQARRQAYELMATLDRVVTRVRSESERDKRAAAAQNSANKPNRKRS